MDGVLPFRLIPFRLIFPVSFRVTVCLGLGIGIDRVRIRRNGAEPLWTIACCVGLHVVDLLRGKWCNGFRTLYTVQFGMSTFHYLTFDL